MGIFGSSDEKNEIRSELDEALADLESARRTIDDNLSEAERLRILFSKIPTWRYLSRDDATQDELDSLGKSGWEITAVTSFNTGFGLGGNERIKVHFRYTLRMRLSEYPTEADEYLTTAREWQDYRESLERRIEDLRAAL